MLTPAPTRPCKHRVGRTPQRQAFCALRGSVFFHVEKRARPAAMGPLPRTPTSHHRMWRRVIPPGRLVRFVRLVGCSRKPDAAIGRDEAVDACAGGGATCAVSKLSGLRLARKHSKRETQRAKQSVQRELRQAAAGTPHSTRSTVTIDLHLTLTPTKTPADTHRANREPTPAPALRLSRLSKLRMPRSCDFANREAIDRRQATGDRRQGGRVA